MIEDKKTPCECPLAGYCNRHGVEKSAHFHKLCQNHTGYFNMWEECRGPKQNPNDCVKGSPVVNDLAPQENIPEPREEVKLPSAMQMAKNFVSSAVKHVQTGMNNATPELQAERLKICSECPFIVENGSRCGKCGCFLETKTKWESSSCPINKW